MNLDSLECSIQNLLSVLYPPFEATAPILLSQLFLVIESRFQGDALRCLLDFLVPAKHILDSVQQAACAPYSDVLFLCEGWPLCLHDQVVVHLAPADPLELQPGDFYLQVVPFCDQSARIVVCSLLEEEGLVTKLVEETPVPETSYPCIFSCEWLGELNRDRHGTPLSQCLLAGEKGMVRLPWEHVVVPDFVNLPSCSGNSMASAPSSHLALVHLPPDPDPDNCSSSQFFPVVPLKDSAPKHNPIANKNSPLSPSSHPFSVETRICQAKHGIAVSLCLVNCNTASSSRQVKVEETKKELQPIDCVSPNTWSSCLTDRNLTEATEASTAAGIYAPSNADVNSCKSEDIGQDKDRDRKMKCIDRSEPVAKVAAEGEYIDILQATMLLNKIKEVEHTPEIQMQSNPSIQPPVQKYPNGCAQMEKPPLIKSCRQTQRWPNAQIPSQAQSHAHMKFQRESQMQSHCRPEAAESLKPNMFSEEQFGSTLHHSQIFRPHHDSPDTSQCIRTIQFSEKPCTPCMRRRQGGKVSRAQEMRCRYRDSYQAALQNPVAFGQGKEGGNMLAMKEEDGELTLLNDTQRLPETTTGDSWFNVQQMGFDVGMEQQFASSVSTVICKESGEKSTVPHWKSEDPINAVQTDCRENYVLRTSGISKQVFGRTTLALGETRDSYFSKSSVHSVNGINVIAQGTINTNGTFSRKDHLQSKEIPLKNQVLPACPGQLSDSSADPRLYERQKSRITSMEESLHFLRTKSASQSQESKLDGRCSSLSTAVVDTSEKCELVIVEGRNVRRKDATESSAEIPQLHVVKCKHSTAFRLVSPKINRKNNVTKDGSLHGNNTIVGNNGDLTKKQSQIKLCMEAEIQKMSQPALAPPRPDNLPLGTTDPRVHLLFTGVASLTGGRDRMGRAVVELYGDHQGWRASVTSQELLKMLLYFHTITRREIREAGLTLIFDAKKTNPPPQLYKALMTLQEQTPQAINSFVLLVDKDTQPQPGQCPRIQTEIVTSSKALLKLVEGNQLTSRLEGTLSRSPLDWMELHQKLFPFVSDLYEASSLLLRAISKLEEPRRMDSVLTVQQCMTHQRTLMQDVLEDSRLVSLQREGGAMLARLRKESDLKYPDCKELSDAVDSVTSLYNHVEEQAHVLVQRSNLSLEHLEYLLQVREIEGHIMQIQQWFTTEGEQHLVEAGSVEDSGDRMEQILNTFTSFLIEANDRRQHAITLVSEAEGLQQSLVSYPETEGFWTLVCTFKSWLEDFFCRTEACGRDLQTKVNVCDFCEQAVALAMECTEYLNQSHSKDFTMKDAISSPANQKSKQHQSIECRSSSPHLSLSNMQEAQGLGPRTTSILLSENDSSILQAFQDRFLQFSPEKFQEVKVQACSLQGSSGMRNWNIAWLKCQEARQQLEERLQDGDKVLHHRADSSPWNEHHYVDVVSTNAQTLPPGGQNLVVQSTPGPRHPQWEGIITGAVDLGKRRPILGSNSTNPTTLACCNIGVKPEESSDAGTSQSSKATPQSPQRSVRRTEREARRRQASRARSERDAAALSQSHTVGCQWFPWGRSLGTRSVSQDSCTTRVVQEESSPPPEQRVRSLSSCAHHGQPSCRILEKAQKFQISRHGSFCSENSCASDQAAAGGDETFCYKHSSLPIGRYEGMFCFANRPESSNNALRLQRVLEELVLTEREYVRSLGYILTHYLPLLDTPDIPQDLRGKRGVIFGNLEKLFDFHSHYFLPELEACQMEPAMVARCFLRHRDSFGLYALYSKNKPQSDALILHCRYDIFKKKQQELGDMMDLSSYLLRPIQRISKYCLLLQDMLALSGSYRPKEMIKDPLHSTSKCIQSVCGPCAFVPDLTSSERERERAEIKAAADLVRFQMRHGNDLLTMDAIQECDVNLKEQGQLVRQDEFTVLFRKKKCVRRIFLFEDLILFSKTKRTDIGNDVYIYKQSFKTCDIGMTHNSNVSGLCFEIWFRRRKSEDTYTLKASCMEVKKAWTTDLERILWDQATHSRELRLQERVFMGMGCKPFMDIQPSDAAICERAVSCHIPGKIPVACCSHRSIEYPRPHSTGSGSTASTTISQSSSSSGRGSLPPAGNPGNLSHGLDFNPAGCSSSEAVTENELRNPYLHQHKNHHNCEQWKTDHPLANSTDSSGEGINPFSSSDHSCLSAISGEVVASSSSSSAFLTQRSKQCQPLCCTPSKSKNYSPSVTRKRNGVAHRPLHLAAEGDDVRIGKSTEV